MAISFTNAHQLEVEPLAYSDPESRYYWSYASNQHEDLGAVSYHCHEQPNVAVLLMNNRFHRPYNYNNAKVIFILYFKSII